MKRLAIGGLKGAGKTSLLTYLIRQLKERNQTHWAGFKPFDCGLLADNAKDLDSDGEVIAGSMHGVPHATLVNPYHAHESLPLEIALLREGVEVNLKTVDERLGFLVRDYEGVIVELLSSVWTPVAEETTMLSWLQRLDAEVVWVVRTEAEFFERNLAELASLKTAGISVNILLNNASRVMDQDWLLYLWQKLQELSGFDVFGMLPKIDTEDDKEGDFNSWNETLEPLFKVAFQDKTR